MAAIDGREKKMITFTLILTYAVPAVIAIAAIRS